MKKADLSAVNLSKTVASERKMVPPGRSQSAGKYQEQDEQSENHPARRYSQQQSQGVAYLDYR